MGKGLSACSLSSIPPFLGNFGIQGIAGKLFMTFLLVNESFQNPQLRESLFRDEELHVRPQWWQPLPPTPPPTPHPPPCPLDAPLDPGSRV